MKWSLLVLSLLFVSFGIAQSIKINEFMSINETTISDEDGDYSDWIELFNYGDTAINLNGFYISDDTSFINQWEFPDTLINSGEFILIFASGKDRLEGPYFHTNFKIKSEGEYLILSYTSNIIEVIEPVMLEPDVSFGRKPDGSGQWYYLEFPSPSTSNNYSNSLIFSHQRGFYTEPFKLNIASLTGEDQIYYTTDGSVPTINADLFVDSIPMGYSYYLPNKISVVPTTPDSIFLDFHPWKSPNGPVDKIRIIRARAFNGNIPSSKVYTNTYLVDSAIYGKYPYPVISLVTDSSNLFDYDTGIYVPGVHWDEEDPLWTGNYYQKGDEWERDMHIEYFEESGEIGFFQDAGVRIHGKQTRRRPQKTLRFYSGEEYNKNSFDYKLLPNKPTEHYQKFLLSNTYGCWFNTLFKDEMTNQIIKNLGFDWMDYRLVVVFINGEYWGIQTIRDYYDENYLSQIYEIDKDSIDLLENRNILISGSDESYNQLIDFISSNDMSVDENYEFAEAHIDINNFINYQIAEIYFNNYDWPASNIKFWKSKDLDNKWRWIFFDSDAGFGDYNYNMIEHATLEGGNSWPNPYWSTLILRKLLENENFKEMFLDRFALYLSTIFQADSILGKIQTFKSYYELEINRHIYRWNYPKNIETWETNMGWSLIYFAIERPCSITEDIMEYFDLEDFGFSCDTVSQPIIHDQGRFKLHPNPNEGIFGIEIPQDISDEFIFELFNLQGSLLYTHRYDSGMNNHKSIQFNLKHFGTGLYLIKLTSKEYIYIERIIIR